MRFTKPSMTIPEQLAKLQARGLQVVDRATAEHCLRYVGYYLLAAFSLTLQLCTNPGKPSLPCTTIVHLIALYRFDSELRLLLLDAIERKGLPGLGQS